MKDIQKKKPASVIAGKATTLISFSYKQMLAMRRVHTNGVCL
jgi:hypothetical protein